MRGVSSFFFAICIGVLALPGGAHAQAFDPVGLVGLDIPSALELLGPPLEMFAYRGTEEIEDNVVFFYSDFTYLFWFRNRVWQVRCDKRFEGDVFGLKLGMRREDVSVPEDWKRTDVGDSLYFDVIEAEYPIRVRLVFSAGYLNDLYVYRSDY